ncbi:UNVERIFIED_CONTAM: hypothetical protein FKN15_019102 [Acipenser sinensis]
MKVATTLQEELNRKWRQERGLPDPEPTELQLAFQRWVRSREAPLSPAPEGEAPLSLPLAEPRGEELPLPEPRGEEPLLPEPRGEEPPLPEPRGEAKSIPPPQHRPPPLRSSPASLRPVPRPLLLDTLPVFLDLPVLDLEPKSLQHWPQLCPWFPAPLSPRAHRRRWAAARLPRPTLRSPLSYRWGPSSPLLGELLLDRHNFTIMTKYISKPENLKLMMNLLRDKSPNIQFEAFHVFKVFVANPNKTQPIVDILLKNQTKLIEFLSNFQKDRTDDEQFNDEKTYLIKQIRDLKKPAS